MKTIVLGPPGTGKTETLLDKVEDHLKKTDPNNNQIARVEKIFRFVKNRYALEQGMRSEALAGRNLYNIIHFFARDLFSVHIMINNNKEVIIWYLTYIMIKNSIKTSLHKINREIYETKF